MVYALVYVWNVWLCGYYSTFRLVKQELYNHFTKIGGSKETMIDNEKYRNYLQSDEWKAIAKQRLDIDKHTCTMCGCKGTTANPLEIHHLSYRYLYREQERIYEDLITLCHCCHKQIHQAMNRVTNADGRQGWKSNRYIPQVHVFNINGTEQEHTEVKR